MNKILHNIMFKSNIYIFAQYANAEKIRFWTTEEQPARLAKQKPWPKILKKELVIQ